MSILNLSVQDWRQIIISAGIVIAALLLTGPILNFILDKIAGRITRLTKSVLDNYIIEAIRTPLFWLVILMAIETSLTRLDFLSYDFRSGLGDIAYILYSLLVLAVLWRLINAVANWYIKEIAETTETPLDNQVVPFMRRILLIVLVVIIVIIVLGHFEVEISGLVATLGIGSLAVALAAQAALADTISGFVIMADRPFRIGDRIEILELDTWGDVQDIGLRSTRIRTPDNRTVIVPNSIVSKSLVVNYAYPNSEYRIETHVGVAYGTDLELARTTLVDAVKQVEGVDPDHPVEALFIEFGDSALVFRVRWWLNSYVDTRRMFDKVNTAMYNALNQAGISIPFPQRDVHLKMESTQKEQVEKTLPS